MNSRKAHAPTRFLDIKVRRTRIRRGSIAWLVTLGVMTAVIYGFIAVVILALR